MGKDLKGKELGSGINQRKDGKYQGRYCDRFGKRKSVYGKTLRECRSKLEEAKYQDAYQMNILDDSLTLDGWFEKWMEIHKYDTIRINTRRSYTEKYYKHISPVLGHHSLSKITQLMIKGLLKSMEQNGLGYEMRNGVRIMLLDMFNKAMIDEFVLRNPAKGIKVTRDEEYDYRVLSQEEQADFFDCCKGTFYDNLFVTAVTTGLRPGELCALTRDDIDFEKKTIRVNKTLIYQKFEEIGDNKKTFHVGDPKTRTSNRIVVMGKRCQEALMKQIVQKKVVEAKSPKKPLSGLENILFVTKYNSPINAQIYSDAIGRIIDEVNLMKDGLEEMEKFSGHAFRHTFATNCFEAGMDAPTVQRLLGHADLTMTMRYTHVLDKHKNWQMDKLEAFQNDMECSKSDLVEERFRKANDSAKNNKIINFA